MKGSFGETAHATRFLKWFHLRHIRFVRTQINVCWNWRQFGILFLTFQ